MSTVVPEITVIIATYNPDLGELKKTIRSVLLQKDERFEIVITDDGSTCFPFEQIKDFFQTNGFNNYSIVANKENKGTVHNIFTGILNANGKYIKLISPGDCLASEMALHYLMNSIISQESDMVFDNIAYYIQESKEFTLKKHKAHPQNVIPYQRQKCASIWYNYLILDDTIHGLSTYCKKELLYNIRKSNIFRRLYI